MAAVRIRRAINRRRRRGGTELRQHPHVVLSAGGLDVEVDYVSRTADEAGVAPTYEEVDRPGRTPLLLRSGRPLPRLSFDATFLRGNTRHSVESRLAELRRLADSGLPVIIRNYGPSAAGRWRLVDVSIAHDSRRHGNNHTTRATVSLTFTRVSDATVHVGPLSGGAKPPPAARPPAKPGAPAAKPAPRVHVVKAGDTLWAIAVRFYGNGNKWKRVADANGIRDPRKLRIGTRLTIPA